MSVGVELILLGGQAEKYGFVRLVITIGKLTWSIQSPTRVIWEYGYILYVFFY